MCMLARTSFANLDGWWNENSIEYFTVRGAVSFFLWGTFF